MTSRSARIAARTTVDSTKGNVGRTRYHGKPKRGQPTAAERDADDIARAMRELVDAGPALAYARSDEAKLLPTYQRREKLQAALAKVALAVRFAESALDRGNFDHVAASPKPEPKPAKTTKPDRPVSRQTLLDLKAR